MKIAYFGRRRRTIDLDGLSLDISWVWDFRRLEIADGSGPILKGESRSRLRKGVRLSSQDVVVEVRLKEPAGVASDYLLLRRLDRFKSLKIIDPETRIAKHALFAGLLGLVYLIFALVADLGPRDRWVSLAIGVFASWVAVAPKLCRSRWWAGGLLLFFPAVLAVTMMAVVVYSSSLVLKVTAVVGSGLTIFRSVAPTKETWEDFVSWFEGGESDLG